MTNGAFDALFGGPPRKPESASRSARWTSRASVQVVTEEIMLRMARHVAPRDRPGEPLPRGRRRAQLRRQRPAPARGPVRAALDPARGRRRGRRARRRARDLAPAARTARADAGRPRRDAGLVPRPGVLDDEIEAFLDAGRRGLRAPPDRTSCSRATARAPGRREGRRLVPGPHGVRPARARRPQHPRRPALPEDAVGDEPEDQVPRELPAVRAERAARARRDYFELDADSPYMLLVAPVQQDAPHRDDRRAAAALRHREAERAALRHPRGHARRLLGAHPDRARARRTRSTTRCSRAFTSSTGCPVLVNTSFNVRGEPIVCTPEDAYRCFMRTEMDQLVLGSFILDKAKQPALRNEADWRGSTSSTDPAQGSVRSYGRHGIPGPGGPARVLARAHARGDGVREPRCAGALARRTRGADSYGSGDGRVDASGPCHFEGDHAHRDGRRLLPCHHPHRPRDAV